MDETDIREAIKNSPARLEGHAVGALMAQREIARREHAAGRDACWVGGFAQITTVTDAAVTTRIIRRWPDEIGRPLDPTVGEAMPGWLVAGDQGL